MEMTRRKFVRKLTAAGLAIFAGASWCLNKASPPKFIRAVKFRNYPGPVRPFEDITRQGKWSG